jgi:periplasmic divalent cation tolerance protein
MAEERDNGDVCRLAVCLTTAADETEAVALSRTLVEERLAACVSRVPVRSTYRWDDEVRDDAETLLIMKVPAACTERLRERLEALSSYDVPEFVVLEVGAASAEYLAWALSSCGLAE